MKQAFKNGFGFAVGSILGYSLLKVVSERVIRHIVNDEKYMEKLKNRNPKQYEELKKYQ